jgi:SAM-dependent methyltransferase
MERPEMTPTRSSEYSRSFCGKTRASTYDRFYERGTADEAIWSIERDFLVDFFARHKAKWPECSYLDFACGTGRVIAFMEQFAAFSRGVDISPDMLEAARKEVSRSELICADVTAAGAVEGRYDLITAFRFFLNAEPPLSTRVMQSLARLLKNPQSRLVFSNHGNPCSYKAIAWPVHRARQFVFGRKPAGNYLTHSEVERLVEQANLKIVERFGCGVVSPKLFNFAPATARKFERRIGGKVGRLGVNQIYVVAIS